MTTEIKYKIITEIEKGKGYGTIAQELGLKKSTVAKYVAKYRREGASSLFLYCPQCGKRFLPLEGPTPKRFCCKECKDKWWNTNSKEKKRTYTIKCAHCGKLFSSLTKESKYCCHNCYCAERFGK